MASLGARIQGLGGPCLEFPSAPAVPSAVASMSSGFWSSLGSLDLIQSYRSLDQHEVDIERILVYTNPFVDIPAAVLGSLSSISHALVCLKVPIQMTGFLFPAFVRRREATATSATFIRLRLIKRNNKSNSRAIS